MPSRDAATPSGVSPDFGLPVRTLRNFSSMPNGEAIEFPIGRPVRHRLTHAAPGNDIALVRARGRRRGWHRLSRWLSWSELSPASSRHPTRRRVGCSLGTDLRVSFSLACFLL